MTTAERVQAAYAWACSVRDKRKASMMLMFCACQVRRAVENAESDEWDIAHDSIIVCVNEWKAAAVERQRRHEKPSPDLMKSIDVVSLIMGITG